jgi:hypothetical protein
LALAACGGEEPQVEERTVTGPTIERGVAEDLAERSDNVANLLDQGDACGAKDEAAKLREDLTEAINNREIPPVYLEDLSALVNEIEAQTIPPCDALQPPPHTDTEEDKKKDGDGDGDD